MKLGENLFDRHCYLAVAGFEGAKSTWTGRLPSWKGRIQKTNSETRKRMSASHGKGFFGGAGFIGRIISGSGFGGGFWGCQSLGGLVKLKSYNMAHFKA